MGLTRAGYQVDVARDGESGLDMALERPYGAIVLDIMLPKMDGWTVCRQVREHGVAVPNGRLPKPPGRLPSPCGRKSRSFGASANCWSAWCSGNSKSATRTAHSASCGRSSCRSSRSSS
ncbi:MAG: response regulator [Fimbriimonadaceae bacterium]|nr:response regulator [Fimbriimonadaceae bacterium]